LLISADYSQIELRIVACLSQDVVMLKAFRDGVDIHSKTASEIFDTPVVKITNEQRRVAKTVNFGVICGISPYGLSQTLGIEQSRAAEYILRYFKIHSGIKRYCQEQVDLAKKLGYVETLFGFQRKLPEINSPIRAVAEGAQRMAINTPVQGTAAEVLKLAMIKLYKKLSAKEAKLILTVHDELIVEAPKTEAQNVAKLMKEIMENEVKLCIPVEVEIGIGRNWNEAKNSANKS